MAVGSLEAIWDGCRGAWRPLWTAVGELGGRCGRL